jgi:hypothetical protein
MKPKFKTFYDAWWFLTEHPMFFNPDDWVGCSVKKSDRKYYGNFGRNLFIDVQKVNPITLEIDDNKKLNARTRVWLECGGFIFEENPIINKYVPCHDTDLDCAADTFAEAIVKLANLVYKKYGKGKYNKVVKR